MHEIRHYLMMDPDAFVHNNGIMQTGDPSADEFSVMASTVVVYMLD